MKAVPVPDEQPLPCLSEDRALDYAFGRSDPDAAAVQAHILGCERCRVLVVEAVRLAVPATVTARLTTFADGDKIAGRYTIRRLLARGGMGEVYEADDELLADVVALKTLAVDAAEDPRAIQRLKREVLLARRVSHRHVCRIIEFGVHTPTNGPPVPFMTMERLRGETLGQLLLRGGPLPSARVRTLALEILDGLAAIHRSGIVHRDFKTENVFMAEDGDSGERAVVLDFGLARALEPSGHRLPLTAGRVVGTIEYMSPEQLEGAPPTVRFDVYAFGVVAFELLTGRRPFVGRTVIAEAAKRFAEPPPRPSALRPGLDRGWDRVVLRCLERRPELRYATVEAIREDIGELDEHRPDRQAVPWLPVTVVLGGIALIAGLAGRGSGPEIVSPRVPPATAQPAAPRLATATPTTMVTLAPLASAGEPATIEPEPKAARKRLARRRSEPAPPRAAPTSLPPPAPEFPADPLQQADQLLSQGQLAEACATAERLKGGASETAEVYRFLGKCYMRSGKPSLAKRHYRDYLERMPHAQDAAIIRKILE